MNNLPKELTTVTPFSKTLALILFFVVPMIGFYVGMQYQVLINDIEKQRADLATKAPAVNHPTKTPSPFPQTILPTTAKRALQDLAKSLGVKEEAITASSLEEKEWGDTSLGCPKPGKLYAQVITPGYKVVFEYLSRRYEYHTDKTRTFIRCDTTGNTVR